MISSFFIERPILSSVISIFIFLAGMTSLYFLPIEQFPNILPPQINVQTSYSGASAEVIANSIAAPLEQQINGVEDMIYMNSNSSSTGNYNLNIYFNIGSSIEKALIDVQNQATVAIPLLPDEVQKIGVTVTKQTPSILLVVALQSPDGRYDEIFLSNYATINVVQELQRTPGVSAVKIFNDRTYAMRIWIDPNLLIKYGLSSSEVIKSIQDQNSEYSVGRLGQAPTEGKVETTLSIKGVGRLSTPEEFNNIILKANPDGSIVSLKDVGYAELGAQNYDVISSINGIPTISIGIYQIFGANALQVAKDIKKKMEIISKNFPKGIEYSIPYDTTKFVYFSIHEVVKTIFLAALLVAAVVFLFLQNIRLTIIPIQAMIISVVGTFAGMLALGISINLLTLFAIVLTIGIVVDDAIVVIENIERNIRLYNISPKEAAHRAMSEVTGPIIAIVLVLCAVFIPVAFLGGIAGQLYRQFALTIALSVVISGIVALSLSPALSAILVKPHQHTKFTIWFDRVFEKITNIYISGAHWLILKPVIGMLLFLLICFTVLLLFKTVPTSFIPNEDQGYLISAVNMPEGSSLNRTAEVTKKAEKITLNNPGVDKFVAITGFSFLDSLNRTNQGTNFIILKDWSQRTARNMWADSIAKQLYQQYVKIPQGQIFLFNPPAIQGLGTIGGFEFWIQNKGSGDYEHLETITKNFISEASKRPELTNLIATINANAEQLFVNLDRSKAQSLDVPINEVYRTLQTLFGSFYINNFNKFGRIYRVLIMAKPHLRITPNDISQIYVKANDQKMVPMSSLVTIENDAGPNIISRFNTFPSAKINGSAASGYSTGEALNAMEDVAKNVLPEDMSFAWGGESYQEKQTGGTSTSMLIAGMLMVFLILAALYERWSLPLAIILAVPFGIFGSLLAIWLVGMSNDIYFQIGLITIIALSAKNAILIVEFALIKYQEGMSLIDASLEAGRLRLRAILMTSMAFILGVLPLVISKGAGANSRHSVGMGVLGGMIAATFLAIFFVPLFFRLILGVTERKK